MKKFASLLASVLFIIIQVLGPTATTHANSPAYLRRMKKLYQRRCPEFREHYASCKRLAKRIDKLSTKQTLSPPTLQKLSEKSLLPENLQELFRLVNQERSSRNINPLILNSQLNLAAHQHATDMLKRDYFSHISPEGFSITDRVRASGYLENIECDACSGEYNIAENIAFGARSPKEVLEQWMNSPGHRKNILNESLEDIGLGKEGFYWVQKFGRRKKNL